MTMNLRQLGHRALTIAGRVLGLPLTRELASESAIISVTRRLETAGIHVHVPHQGARVYVDTGQPAPLPGVVVTADPATCTARVWFEGEPYVINVPARMVTLGRTEFVPWLDGPMRGPDEWTDRNRNEPGPGEIHD